MTSSAAMNRKFLHCQNPPFLSYIQCNFCLNVLIIHGAMKENASGCYFSEHNVELVFQQCDVCRRPSHITWCTSYW